MARGRPGHAAEQLGEQLRRLRLDLGRRTRGAWYYHAYLPEQPDLNWRNPEVRAAMLDVLRFWCAHGADGFRVDALRQCIKDDRWRDNPPNPDWREGDDPYARLIPEYTTDQRRGARAGRADARRRSGPTGR